MSEGLWMLAGVIGFGLMWHRNVVRNDMREVVAQVLREHEHWLRQLKGAEADRDHLFKAWEKLPSDDPRRDDLMRRIDSLERDARDMWKGLA